MAMLRILQTATAIRDQIFKCCWSSKHQLSEGKLSVMMVLYEHPEGVAPSVLAENARACPGPPSASCCTGMLRDGLVSA
jgi:hypothetical protein